VIPAEFMAVIVLRMLVAPPAPSLPVVDVYTEPSLFALPMLIEKDPEYDDMMTCMSPVCVSAVWMMVTPRFVPAGPDVCGPTRVGATLLPVAVSMCVTVKVLWAATELNCKVKSAAVKTAPRRISCHISLNCSVGSWYTLTVLIFVMKGTMPDHTIDAI
jgi:hypothetical protein